MSKSFMSCTIPDCNYPEGECSGACDRSHLIMNQSGRFHFKELEMLIIDHMTRTGYVLPNPVDSDDRDKVHIGNMIIDLILLAENMGLDFTDCLAAAYSTRTGAKK